METNPNIWTVADRDLLIRLNENVTSMREEMRAISENTSGRIADHENRLRNHTQAIEQFEGAMSALKWVFGLSGTIVAGIQVFIMWYVGTHHK